MQTTFSILASRVSDVTYVTMPLPAVKDSRWHEVSTAVESSPWCWNDDALAIVDFDPFRDRAFLSPTDYFTLLASQLYWQDPPLRSEYNDIPAKVNVVVMVEATDGLVTSRRFSNCAWGQGLTMATISEGPSWGDESALGTAKRAMCKELGIDVTFDQMSVLGLIAESPTNNVTIVVYAKIDVASSAIELGPDGWELDQLSTLPTMDDGTYDVSDLSGWIPGADQMFRLLNASLAANKTTHFIVLECDMGPGDCGYVQGAPVIGSLPSFWNPADPARAVGHITHHGMRDGADAGFDSCRVCTQKGKDVFIPVERHNACGPLCGFDLAALRKHSQWGKPERLRSAKKRTHTFFFAGSIDVPNAATDVNGRGQVWLAHHDRPGYRIVNTRGRSGPPLDFAEEMSDSVFCYSPLGGGTGPPDRYVAAVLLGCIPVMLSDTFMEGSRTYELSQPLEDVVDWAEVGVLVGLRNLSSLHEVLAAIGPAERERKQRAAGRVWRKLLFTSMYGQYLTENGHRDAFHALMVTLARRAGVA